jgi:hypothetical protein
MAIHPLRLIVGIGLVIALACIASPATAGISLDRADVSWQTIGTQVQFHLRFRNLGTSPSDPASGEVHSQAFGAFNPNYGPIGTFDIPPIMPESFFDVFLEVPLSSLPPSAGGVYHPKPVHATPNGVTPPGCPADNHWDGNIDVFWTEAGVPAQLLAHYGNLQVCAGHGTSYLHVMTHCLGVTTWAIAGVCQGFHVSLLNENPVMVPDGPAPANLAANWSGFVAVTADPNVPVNTQCCFSVTFTCLGVPAVVNVCAVVCDCTPTPVRPDTWGRIRNLYR